MLVRSYGQDDEQVPHQGDQVHAQEESEQKGLMLWVFREAQEQEVKDTGLVSNPHLK